MNESEHLLIESITNRLDRIESKLDKLNETVAKLTVKSSIWGLIGGSIPVIVLIGIQYLK